MSIYENIKKTARLKGLSIKDVTKKAGFKSPNSIYNYKYSTNPSSTSLKVIADVLEVTPDMLKEGVDTEQLRAYKSKAIKNKQSKVINLFGQLLDEITSDLKQYPLNADLDNTENFDRFDDLTQAQEHLIDSYEMYLSYVSKKENEQ